MRGVHHGIDGPAGGGPARKEFPCFPERVSIIQANRVHMGRCRLIVINHTVAIDVLVAVDDHPGDIIVAEFQYIILVEIENRVIVGWRIFPDRRGGFSNMHPVIIQIAEPGALIASGVQCFRRIKYGLDQIGSLPGLLGENGDRGGGGSILRDTPKDVGQSITQLLGIISIIGMATDRGITMSCHLIEVTPGCIRKAHTQDKSLDAVGIAANFGEGSEGVEFGLDSVHSVHKAAASALFPATSTLGRPSVT